MHVCFGNQYSGTRIWIAMYKNSKYGTAETERLSSLLTLHSVCGRWMSKGARSFGAMSLTGETKAPWEKPVPPPLYPSQLPHMDQHVIETNPPLGEVGDSHKVSPLLWVWILAPSDGPNRPMSAVQDSLVELTLIHQAKSQEQTCTFSLRSFWSCAVVCSL
jgi:hypothetical protein